MDVLLAEQHLADSREQAQRLIMAGQVRAQGQPAVKPGQRFARDTALEVLAGLPFVSRGGEKLEAAFRAFALDVSGRTCVDVGASTGGFTDCLLQRGASRVFAVDVGKGQLHWRLRNDPRVTVMENINARYLVEDSLPQKAGFACIDVSFISLTNIMPAVLRVLAPVAEIVALVKPQFEAGRKQVGKGGVVRDENARRQVLEKIRSFGVDKLGLSCIGVCESPLKGPAGNVEFLMYWRRD